MITPKSILPFLFACVGAASLFADAPQERARAYTFPWLPYSWDERLTIEVLQGIVNREQPQLFFTQTFSDWEPKQAKDAPPKKTVKWTDVYAKEYGIDFKPIQGMSNLVRQFKGELNGVVLYDSAIDGTRYVAATIGALDNLLPVAKGAKWYAKSGLDLPVKIDLTGKFQNSVEAYEWAIKEVYPRANKKVAHTPSCENVDGKYIGWGFYGMDYVAAEKGMIWNLAFMDNDAESFNKRVIQGAPDQAALYRRLLSMLEKPALIFGYGEPELDWFALVGEYGHTYLHWGDNMSFHSRVKAKKQQFRQKTHIAPEAVKVDESKYYIAFTNSEGDTMKGPEPFFYGSWFEPARGTVPMNWCIHPEMVRFPAMLEYFYDSATPNDYFVAMQVYNFQLPNLDQFAHHVKGLMEKADMRVTIGDYAQPSRDPAKKAQVMNIIRPLGIFEPFFDGPDRLGENTVIGDNIPTAVTSRKLAYWNRLFPGGWNSKWQQMYEDPARRETVLEMVLGQIRREAAGHKPPYLIVVYTDLHDFPRHCEMHAEIVRRLDPEKFKAVRLDEGLSILKKINEKAAQGKASAK